MNATEELKLWIFKHEATPAKSYSHLSQLFIEFAKLRDASNKENDLRIQRHLVLKTLQGIINKRDSFMGMLEEL